MLLAEAFGEAYKFLSHGEILPLSEVKLSDTRILF